MVIVRNQGWSVCGIDLRGSAIGRDRGSGSRKSASGARLPGRTFSHRPAGTRTSVWAATNDQDRSLVERAHAGISGSAYEPGPYSPFTEGLVEKFCEWYLDRLADGLGSDGPRAP